MCDVKVGENGETPGYARPPSAVLAVGPRDKQVLALGARRGNSAGASIASARASRSSNLYDMSRPRSTACLVM